MDSSTHRGGCLCGAVTYSFRCDPIVTAICHCTHCQKQSGSLLSMVCAIPRDMLKLEGAPSMFLDRGESGGEVERHFCGACGSPIYSALHAVPHLAFIKAGTLERWRDLKPTVETYRDSSADWFPAFENVTTHRRSAT